MSYSFGDTPLLLIQAAPITRAFVARRQSDWSVESLCGGNRLRHKYWSLCAGVAFVRR